MDWYESTAPAKPAISVPEFKLAARMPGDDAVEDNLIDVYIRAAEQVVEHKTESSLINHELTLELEDFVDEIVLPRPPLVSVDSFQYRDVDTGNYTTVSSALYWVSTSKHMIYRAADQSWPSVARGRHDAVQIVITCGYGENYLAIPKALRAACQSVALGIYENRSEFMFSQFAAGDYKMNPGTERMLAPFRRWGA